PLAHAGHPAAEQDVRGRAKQSLGRGMNVHHRPAFIDWRSAQQAAVEQALSAWVPADAPAGLGETMRYAVLDGGKRLRPLLALATCEAVGGNPRAAMRAACPVELIHAYSLVQDDMPCLDNVVLRLVKT